MVVIGPALPPLASPTNGRADLLLLDLDERRGLA